MIGQRFEKLLVVDVGKRPHHFICRCDCGSSKEVYKYSLLNRDSTSCGCKKIKHGGTKTPLYRIFGKILERCYNKNHVNFHNYGGRGITVCEEWRNDFSAFKNYIGERPTPQHSVDRIDNNGNYEPGNVKWSTPKEQGNNSRLCRFITIKDETRSITQWAEHFGLDRFKIYDRLRRGYTEEQAILGLIT